MELRKWIHRKKNYNINKKKSNQNLKSVIESKRDMILEKLLEELSVKHEIPILKYNGIKK